MVHGHLGARRPQRGHLAVGGVGRDREAGLVERARDRQHQRPLGAGGEVGVDAAPRHAAVHRAPVEHALRCEETGHRRARRDRSRQRHPGRAAEREALTRVGVGRAHDELIARPPPGLEHEHHRGREGARRWRGRSQRGSADRLHGGRLVVARAGEEQRRALLAVRARGARRQASDQPRTVLDRSHQPLEPVQPSVGDHGGEHRARRRAHDEIGVAHRHSLAFELREVRGEPRDEHDATTAQHQRAPNTAPVARASNDTGPRQPVVGRHQASGLPALPGLDHEVEDGEVERAAGARGSWARGSGCRRRCPGAPTARAGRGRSGPSSRTG